MDFPARQEKYGERTFNRSLIESGNALGVIVMSGKEDLETFSDGWMLDPDKRDRIRECAGNGETMSVTVISTGLETFALLRITDGSGTQNIVVDGKNAPTTFVANLFQNAILEESPLPSPK